jgi:Holliday junction resolvase RusA-like endonuclease
MTQTKLFIPIKPIPAPRPRVTRHGTYNDPKYTNYKKAIALYCQHYFGVSDKPIAMHVIFLFGIPKSWSKQKKEAIIWHTSRPDSDNLLKGIKDALNGIAYIDDAQVCYVSAKKQYAENEGIEIEIIELKG